METSETICCPCCGRDIVVCEAGYRVSLLSHMSRNHRRLGRPTQEAVTDRAVACLRDNDRARAILSATGAGERQGEGREG